MLVYMQVKQNVHFAFFHFIVWTIYHKKPYLRTYMTWLRVVKFQYYIDPKNIKQNKRTPAFCFQGFLMLASLVENVPSSSILRWMGFNRNYDNCFRFWKGLLCHGSEILWGNRARAWSLVVIDNIHWVFKFINSSHRFILSDRMKTSSCYFL